MAHEDLLARVRSLDPNLRFDDGDPAAEAGAALERVRARASRPTRPARRALGVAVIAATAVVAVLLLPALAIGTSPLPFHLLGARPAAAPPVNGLIAAQGPGALYVVDPKSGGFLALQGTADMGHPVWSPDGRFLAVERTEKGGVTSVYTIWPNGTHAQLVLANASSPAWSEDGTRIFVERDTCAAPGGCEESEDETTVVYSVSTDGTGAHPIGDDDYDVSQPGWPPGQNVLSFLEASNGPTVGPTEIDSSHATWSPDATELAFADEPTGLWVADEDGQLRLLVKGAFSSLSWGVERPDGPKGARSPAAGSARR